MEKAIFIFCIFFLINFSCLAQDVSRKNKGSLKSEVKNLSVQIDSLQNELNNERLKYKNLEIQLLAWKAKYDTERAKSLINNHNNLELQQEIDVMDSLLLVYERRYHSFTDSINQLMIGVEQYCAQVLHDFIVNNLVLNNSFNLKYVQDLKTLNDGTSEIQILVKNANKILKSVVDFGNIPNFKLTEDPVNDQLFTSKIDFNEDATFNLELNGTHYSKIEDDYSFDDEIEFSGNLKPRFIDKNHLTVDFGEVVINYNNKKHLMKLSYSLGRIDSLTEDIVFQSGIVLWNDQCVFIFENN